MSFLEGRCGFTLFICSSNVERIFYGTVLKVLPSS